MKKRTDYLCPNCPPHNRKLRPFGQAYCKDCNRRRNAAWYANRTNFNQHNGASHASVKKSLDAEFGTQGDAVDVDFGKTIDDKKKHVFNDPDILTEEEYQERFRRE